MVHRKTKGEVEIAVIEGATPPHANLMATHQPAEGPGIKRFLKKSKVSSVLILPAELIAKPPERHIGDGEQAGEPDAEPTVKFTAVVLLEGLL